MKRKLLSSLLALSMVTMLFTGCGKEEPVTSEVVENAQVEEQEAEEPEVIEEEIVEEVSTVETYPDDMVIEFKDKELEKFIREWIWLEAGDITYERIRSLDYLRFYGNVQYTDLSPLVYFTGLKKIIVEDCNDISFLSTIPNESSIKTIIISGGEIADISYISNITNLEEISIAYQESLEDLSFLENLTNLKSVSISYCFNIKNINAISNLTELESFYLEYGDGPCDFDGNISPLSNLTNLKTLEMRMDMNYTYFDGFITDLSPLSNLTNLEELVLEGCFVSEDINALSSLVNLKSLTLKYEYLNDVSAISNMTNLETLTLYGYSKLSSTPWSDLTKLSFFKTDAKDISFLDGATSIKELVIVNKEVKDISAVGTLVNLENLELEYCEYLQDISPISNCTKLKSLKGCGLKVLNDISPIENLTNLEHIDINGCRLVNDISILNNLTNLNDISLFFEGVNGGERITEDNIHEFLN